MLFVLSEYSFTIPRAFLGIYIMPVFSVLFFFLGGGFFNLSCIHYSRCESIFDTYGMFLTNSFKVTSITGVRLVLVSVM